MTIYIDNEYKCYIENDGTMTEIETDFFNGRCRKFIEGYRFVPAGQTWTREDGEIFTGEMVSPLRDYEILSEVQEVYQEEQDKATAEIAAIVEEVYASDMEVINNV